MFLSVRDKRLVGEAVKHRVFDKDTGKVIPNVVWADDETGRYRQLLTGEDGRFLLNEKKTEVLSSIRKGNIELRRIF